MPHQKSTRNCIIASNKKPHEIEIELATFLRKEVARMGLSMQEKEAVSREVAKR
ncbi:hypothetical protein J7K43_04600 [Candidatus Calescamantes bacterium]|nr:hypothetical protein [Candidatus Calescamantes bacterium]